MFTKKKSLSAVGTMISIIGIIALPEDVGTWGSRITTVREMVGDNPISGVAIVVGLAMLTWANWGRIGRVFGCGTR